MSNTLKFGNGKWAVKEGSTLAYNDENGNYKPLPFTFDRAGSATRVNKQGLIEVVSNNEPRIDFLNDSKGALLLEPSRTNYVENSELTNTWTYTEFGSGSSGTITTGKTDMFGGTNAVQIDFPADAENVSIRFGSTVSALTSGSASLSLYIKLVESGSKDLQLRASFSGIVNVNSTEFTRVELSGTKITSELFNLKLRPSEGTSNGGFSIIVCHPQEEQGSYSTSYIPTQGSIGTRVAESCNGAGNEQVFNDSEGVLFAEISALANDGNNRSIAVINNNTNRISFRYDNSANRIEFYCIATTQQYGYSHTLSDVKEVLKVAFLYSDSNFQVWINGIKVDFQNSGTTPTGLSSLDFNLDNGTNDFKGNTKQIKYFDKALTDAELAALTQV